ncbi:MAG: flagellar hook-associated protein FlgL [Thermodesulfobacteriota bacterium]
MRVTTNILYDTYIRDINRQYQSLFKTQRELATGKKISTPSDDPARVGKLLDSKSLLSRLDQYERNVDSGVSYLGVAENALSDATDILSRLKELAVLNATDTANQDMRKVAAIEAGSLFEGLRSLGNTSFEGGYIFAGNKTDAPPFDASGLYTGDSGERVININANSSMTLGINGEKVFKGAGGGVDVFQIVTDMITALNANDAAGIASSITSLESASIQISNTTAEVGGRNLRLSSTRESLTQFKLDLKISISTIEDADITTVISELQLGNMALNAAMSSSAKIFSQSLLHFL